MIQYLLIMAATAAISGVTTYIVGKQLLKETKTDLKQQVLEAAPDVIDYLIEEFEGFLTTPEGAKLVYSVGALIGNGAKQGLGLTGRGGKFKFEDILAQVAGGFVQRYLGQSQTETTRENRNTNKSGMNIS